MDYIKPLQYQRIDTTRTQEDTDAPISETAKEHFTGLTENALNVSLADSPLSTIGDVQGAYAYGMTYENQQRAEDTLDTIESLAAANQITPKEAYALLHTAQPVVPNSLERLQASQATQQAAAEDVNVYNHTLESPESIAKHERFLTNLATWKSLRAMIESSIEEGSPVLTKDGKASPGSKAGYFLKGWLPYYDVFVSGTKASFVPGNVSPFTYDVENAQETVKRMKSMSTDEFAQWSTNLLAYLVYEKKMSLPQALDLWDKAINPSNENLVSFMSDIADSYVILKGGMLGLKTTESASKLAKTAGAVKGLAKGAIQAVPFAETATGVTKKVFRKTVNFATDKFGLKLATGNYEGAVKTILSDIEKGVAGVESAEEATAKVYKNIVEPMAKPDMPLYPQAGRHNLITNSAQLYETEAALAQDISQRGLLNNYYQNIQREAIEGRLKNIFNNDNITEISEIQPVYTSQNKFTGRVTIGKDSAVPFASKDEAAKALQRWSDQGIALKEMKPRIIESTPGSWWIQATVEVNEPISKVFKKAFKGHGDVKPKFLLGTRGSLPSHWEGIRALAQIDADYIRHLVEPYKKAINGLNKADKELLETLKELSQEKWFTPEYLLEIGVPQRVVSAYEATRIVEDLQWSMHGFDMSTWLREDGYQSIAVSPDKPVITGKLVDVDDADYNGRWFVTGDGTEPEQLTKKDFVSGKYKDYAIVEQLYTVDSVPAKKAYLLVPKEHLRVFPLDKFFGSYIPGYRHFYDPDAFFIKQPVISRLPNARRVVTDVATLAGSMSQEAAVGWAKEVENVRKLVADFLDAPHKGKSIKGKIALDNIIREMSGKYVSWNSTDDFLQFAKEHNINMDPKAVIGVLKEGDEYNTFGDLLKGLLDEGESEEEFAKFLKRNRYSSPSAIAKLQRGEGVRDILTDSHLPWISLDKELDKVVRDMERFGTMNTYTKLFANDWYDTFSDIMQKNVDPITALKKGLVNQAGDPIRVQQALYAKTMHDYIRGVPNALDKAVENWLGNALLNLGTEHAWLKQIPLLGNAFKEGSRTYNMLSKLTPLNYLRTWTAHYYLGFMNPRQLLAQGLAVFNTISISPVAGAKALPYSFIVPSLLAKSDKEALTLAQKMIKNADQVADVSKLDVLVNNLKVLGVQSASIKGGVFAGLDTNMSKLSRLSLWFFNKGETFNRVHAAITALMEKGLAFSDIAKLSPDEMSALVLRMNDLYMNMGKTGVSFAQMSALGKNLLQMKGFQLRYLEALTGKTLTSAERARLLMFNLLATGVKGTIGGSIAYNVYDWITEDAGVSDELALSVQEGLLNTLSRQISDHPIDFSNLLSPEAGNIIEDVFTLATQGPLQFTAESTAAGKTWQSFATAANIFSMWINQKADIPLIKSTFAMLAAQKSLPSGLNNIAVAAHIATAGRKMSASGYLIGEDLTNYHAAAALLGLPLLAEKDYYEMIIRRGDEKEKENNAFKDIEPVLGLMIKDPTNTWTLDYFSKYFAIVADDYELTTQQRNNVWNKAMSHGLDRDTEFAKKIPAGIIQLKGMDRAKPILKAKGYYNE